MRYHHYSNKELADILREMAAFYEMEGVAFKPRAYERAADSIESLGNDVYDEYLEGGEKKLDEIPGIGSGIAEHLKELFVRGSFREYDAFRKKIPVKVLELTGVEGVGPKTVKALWEKLKVKDVDDLERALVRHRVAALEGFGPRSEEKMKKGIELYRQSNKRFVLGFILPTVSKLEENIKRIPTVSSVAVAGSVRRLKETVGDVDILVAASGPERVMKEITALPSVSFVYAEGPTKTNLRLASGIDVDIRIVPEASWGAALNYFTGSKPHNIELRTLALKQGWKLSEYGLFRGEKMIAGKTEGELYRALGLRYIEPELREMTGEIEAAREGRLPALVGYGDLKGDLHSHTDRTDGTASIEAMADAAEAAGLEYLAITDHTKALPMASGMNETELLKHRARIAEAQEKRAAAGKKLRLFSGVEANIMKDGSLDIDDAALARLDIVGAAVHSHFGLPKKEQTARVVRAMENPNVDIIFHLTGRLLGRRAPIELDEDAVIAAAKRTGTILEIDAFPERLDIGSELIRKCVRAGVPMVVDSDAHSVDHFAALRLGLGQARRGWAEKKDILNTLPCAEFLRRLKR